ncbi:MAG TPA: iron-sulfur cluster assembly scaffold protein [Woeseiaceae bacterium]|nr:iron-sulfur cluster assembly scaffold protein [Woeseiaceae bacterium]
MPGVHYSEQVRRRFAAARYAGSVAGARAAASRGDTRIELSAQVRDGRVARLRYRVFGCPHTIAAAEEACSELEGAAIAALQQFRARDIMGKLEIPVEKTGSILLLEDALAALGRRIADGPAGDD